MRSTARRRGRLPTAEARFVVNCALVLADLPATQRLDWLQRLENLYPDNKIKVAITRLQRSHKRAKYDLYYDIAPLIRWALADEDPPSTVQLRDRLVVALR